MYGAKTVLTLRSWKTFPTCCFLHAFLFLSFFFGKCVSYWVEGLQRNTLSGVPGKQKQTNKKSGGGGGDIEM